MLGVELYDAKSGEKLGKVDRLLATVRIEDLYALNLRRNINLKDLQIEGLELWVTFDAQGRSNFRNIHIPPPDQTSASWLPTPRPTSTSNIHRSIMVTRS